MGCNRQMFIPDIFFLPSSFSPPEIVWLISDYSSSGSQKQSGSYQCLIFIIKDGTGLVGATTAVTPVCATFLRHFQHPQLLASKGACTPLFNLMVSFCPFQRPSLQRWEQLSTLLMEELNSGGGLSVPKSPVLCLSMVPLRWADSAWVKTG